MSPSAARLCNLAAQKFDSINAELGNGGPTTRCGKTKAQITMDGLISDELIFPAPLPDDLQIIIGRQWLQKRSPGADWADRAIAIKRLGGSARKIQPKRAERKAPNITIKKISIRRLS
eukprot:Plantae.Rhodophyta-Hildenbrandia_rubra.ctg1579.p1 GENE.Plantae.Rhodophyta-Hildenbrandia_rubra.ctg1579~~Plantae.Rhodophyta-Hildenbrandia_rubra.ctg1579.p1  ORF type:complete len:118 (+),score=6.38 Plantae.Rhodophyta-Hildenbrandia_rubra.ctg1579:613-966(+)